MSWRSIAVEASEHSPAFVYSVGFLESHGHPEVIVFGLEASQAHTILAILEEDLEAGKSYAEAGEHTGILQDQPIAIRPVHQSQHTRYLGYAMEAARLAGVPDRLRCVQLLWPDARGRFPFEPGCDSLVAHFQPRLEFPVPPSEQSEPWHGG